MNGLALDLKPRPLRSMVEGSPFQPGQVVRVVTAVDREVHDVSGHIGRLELVKYLEYECGFGQSYPGDPMIGVRFRDGSLEEFWKEELA